MKNYSLTAWGLAWALLGSTACKTVVYQSPDGTLPAPYIAYAKPYLGTYLAENGQTSGLRLEGDRLILSAGFEVTGENCQSEIGALADLTSFPNSHGDFDASAPFEARFSLSPGRCAWLPEKFVTFHFNRALTGRAIYQLTVTLKDATADSQGGTPAEVRTWDLKKVE